MGESLSPDRVFDFLGDELEPHPAYDFFAPGPLPLYAGNPNNNNGWLEVDDYLLREIEAMVDEPMAVSSDRYGGGLGRIEVGKEEVWEVNEEWLMAPVTLPPMLAMQPSSVYEVGGPSTIAAEGPSFLLPAPGLPIHPSVIEDLSTRLDRWEQIGAQVEQGQQTAAQRDESIAELTQQV
nr:hypothetical protein [Tanacetum cinerariifolium]